MSTKVTDTPEALIIETSKDSVIDFNELDRRIDRAVDQILSYGMFDGSHHKQWLLDQILRILLDDDYHNRIKEYNSYEDYEDWDEGSPP